MFLRLPLRALIRLTKRRERVIAARRIAAAAVVALRSHSRRRAAVVHAGRLLRWRRGGSTVSCAEGVEEVHGGKKIFSSAAWGSE